MTGPAASCTIELTTGTRIYVAHTPEDVDRMRVRALKWEDQRYNWHRRLAPQTLELRPMAKPDGWPVLVVADQIAAIYPLDQAPDAAQQREVAVTLARPYEVVQRIKDAWVGRPTP